MTPLLLLAALAHAQVAGPTVSSLKERFLAALNEKERAQALAQIETTPPASAQDVAALFDLFSRYSDPALRRSVMASVAKLEPPNPALEPLFVDYLGQPEPEAQLFGINGAYRLRSTRALPLVKRIASRKFSAVDAASISVLSQRNAWWAQYEALSALAQWEGEKSHSLLLAKAKESPAVGRLLGQFFWRRTMAGELQRWARSEDSDDRRRAIEFADAAIEPEDARATRAEMLALMKDAALDEQLRHKLALKIGASSTDEEAAALAQEHDAVKDPRQRLFYAAAAFASRQTSVAPLLARYARESPDELHRRAARLQLVDMLGEDKANALIGEAAAAP